MKSIIALLVASIVLALSQAAHCQSLRAWELAKTTTYRISKGELPSVASDAARNEYFLLMVNDEESIVVYQHPSGTCMVGFPSENAQKAFCKAGHLILTQPLSPTAQGRPITWIKATLDKAGSTPDFFKLEMLRSKDGVTDTVYLSRKGNGVLVQWVIS